MSAKNPEEQAVVQQGRLMSTRKRELIGNDIPFGKEKKATFNGILDDRAGKRIFLASIRKKDFNNILSLQSKMRQ